MVRRSAKFGMSLSREDVRVESGVRGMPGRSVLDGFSAKLAPGPVSNGPGAKHGEERASNQPRKLILRQIRGHILVLQSSKFHAKVWHVRAPTPVAKKYQR